MNCMATVAILTAVLLPSITATDQYQYTFDETSWNEAHPSATSPTSIVAAPARSDIECVSLCEAAAAASACVCVGVVWCPPPIGCRLLSDAAAVAAAPALGCRTFVLNNLGRVSGGWCPWNPWTSWTAQCQAGTRGRSRLCQCPAPQSVASAGCDRSVDGDSQTDQRFLGWSDWSSWTDWDPAGCPKTQARQRNRVCNASITPVVSPSEVSAENQSQFSTWCDWQSWSSWSAGCNVNQARSRVRSCACAGAVTDAPSAESAQTDSQFNGWCGWNAWGGWSSWYQSNCVLVWYRRKRVRTRSCSCPVAYTASPSATSSETDETDCTFNI